MPLGICLSQLPLVILGVQKSGTQQKRTHLRWFKWKDFKEKTSFQLRGKTKRCVQGKPEPQTWNYLQGVEQIEKKYPDLFPSTSQSPVNASHCQLARGHKEQCLQRSSYCRYKAWQRKTKNESGRKIQHRMQGNSNLFVSPYICLIFIR